MTPSDSGQHFETRSRAERKSLTFFREGGRGKALVQINNLAKFNPGLILLMGDTGSGRSRILHQLVESLKGKSGKVCIIDRVLKNEGQLYASLFDGFALDQAPSDSPKSIQKEVHGYIESNSVTQKPLIIAVDNVQLCSLAVLEALLALQTKFKQMSLLLIGDTSLEKMIQRLQASKSLIHPITLMPLLVGEMRQYIAWRLPFPISEIEFNQLVNVTVGNLALLDQEAHRIELELQKGKTKTRGAAGVGMTRKAMLSLLLVFIVGGAAGWVTVFHRDEALTWVTQSITGSKPLLDEIISLASEQLQSLSGQKPVVVKPVENILPVELQIRSNEEWVDRQMSILNQKDVS